MMKKTILLLLAASASLCGCMRETKPERYAREAREVTAQCPMALDFYTTMDSMTYVEADNRFCYYYTVSQLSDSLLLAQREALRPQLRDKLLNAPEMRPYIEDGMAFSYVYRNAEGETLMEFRF